LISDVPIIDLPCIWPGSTPGDSLPDRYPSHQRTRLPGRPRPRNHAGRRADTPDARPTRRHTSSQDMPPARPVRGRPWKPGGYTDRATGPDVGRYTSVDTAI
jgi:hypothetical protein